MSTRRKKAAPPAPEPFPMEFETFRRIGWYEQRQMEQGAPSCFNGSVCVVKYRVRVEVVDEPASVIGERILKLWEECETHHRWTPLKAAAAKHGVVLDENAFGTKRVKP